jgi:CDP-glycerol glycerophosphotransferase
MSEAQGLPPGPAPCEVGGLRLSLVVITERPAWHLRDVLQAAMAQRRPDSELIVVDGAADTTVSWIVDDTLKTSGTGQITIAGGGTLLRPAGATTIGSSREAGQRLARGRHILHLDGRTVLRDGAVDRLLTTVAECDPEVMLLEANETRWWGRPRARVWRAAVKAVAGGAATHPGTPELTEALLHGPIDVPSLIVRADVAADPAFAWSGDRFADRGWFLRLALTRPGLQVSSEPLLEVRRRGPDVERAGRSAGGSEPFTQTRELLAHLSEVPAASRTLVVDRTLRDGLRVLDRDSEDWTRAERRAFIRAARRELRAVVPRTERPQGIRAQTLLTGSGLALSLYGAAKRLRSWPQVWRCAVSRKRGPWRVHRLNAIKWIAKHLPVKRDLVVFSSYGGRSVGCNPLALYRELERQAPGFEGVWVVRPDVSCPPEVRCVQPGTLSYYLAVSRARVLINNYNFGPQVPVRRGTLNVQTQHGAPLKTVGVDLHRYPKTTGGAALAGFVERYGRWNVVLSPSYHASEVLHHSFPGTYELMHTGFPRNDVLFRDTDDLRAATRQQLGIGPNDRAVLFMPTFRDGRRGFNSRVDLHELAADLGTDAIILARAHHFDRRRGGVAPRGDDRQRVIDVSQEPSIEALYLASDVLVTDYSSAMFDYSALGRPIVLYVPDLERYTTRRGLYLDLHTEGPGPVVTDPEGLLAALREVASDEDASQRLDTFRARHAAFDDGHAAQRVVRDLILPAMSRGRAGRHHDAGRGQPARR